MSDKYTLNIKRQTARPRSKRLRESGTSVVNNYGSSPVDTTQYLPRAEFDEMFEWVTQGTQRFIDAKATFASRGDLVSLYAGEPIDIPTYITSEALEARLKELNVGVGGLDMEALESYLTENSYVTQEWVLSQGFLTGVLGNYVDKSGDTMTGSLVVYPTTPSNLAISEINAIANDPNNWANIYNLSLRHTNNALNFYVGGNTNERKAYIQSGHLESAYAQHLGELHLNPFGGIVTINKQKVWHAGNAKSIWGQIFDDNGNIDGVFRELYPRVPNGGVFHSVLVDSVNPYGLLTRIYNDGAVSLQAQREGKSEYFNLCLNPLGGRVGINKLNPEAALDVNGIIRSNNRYESYYPTGDNYHYYFNNSTLGITGGIGTSARGDGIQGAYLWLTGDKNSWRFATNGTARMIICPDGKVGVGTMTPQFALDVVGAIRNSDWFYSSGNNGWYNHKFDGGLWMDDQTWVKTYRKPFFSGEVFYNGPGTFGVGLKCYHHDHTSVEVQGGNYTMGLGCHSNGHWYWWRGTNGTDSANKSYVMDYDGSQWLFTGTIVASGNLTALSDIRVKEHITDLTWRGRLQPKRYLKDNRWQIGFIAQEVDPIVSEAVFKNDLWSLDYGGLVAYAILQCNMNSDSIKTQERELSEVRSELREVKKEVRALRIENQRLRKLLSA